jgi:hypothetical protein
MLEKILRGGVEPQVHLFGQQEESCVTKRMNEFLRYGPANDISVGRQKVRRMSKTPFDLVDSGRHGG